MIESPISREFALKVANWSLRDVQESDGFSWEMWQDESGKMVSSPNFAESVDALMPYVRKFMNISGGDGSWSVSFIINDRNDSVSGYAASLSEALARALIAEKNAYRY